jgi:C-terminal processing protease CtpA/Prc
MRYLIIIIIIIIIAPSLLADTIAMKDGKKLKGLVVDEYVDRVTVSSIDGEKDILRQDIERIEYDSPEQNFMQLGRSYDAKGWYDKAAFYYRRAMEINPDFKEAREAYLASHAKMWRQEERMTKKELERQNMAMEWRRNKYKKDSSQVQDKALLLKDVLGISLDQRNSVFAIDEIKPDSSAAKAGIQAGDLLVGIWGKLIKYSEIEDVIDELLGPKYSEVKVLIEREISIAIEDNKDLYKDLGIVLGFEYEGLIVKELISGERGELAGFKKGDCIIAVDKNITRYLPLDSVIALINSAKGNKNIIFSIRREVNLRREANEDNDLCSLVSLAP